ncbi:MAG: extracellular solute-binding protein [Caulobacteraceae bacterium]
MLRRSLMLAGCLLAIPAIASAQPTGKVSVLYAGSLVKLMESGIGPAFDKATGGTFVGFGGGSNGLGNQIKGKLRRADVFISASPKVDADLMGAANGDWVSWYATFAKSPVVIGYNLSSRFAADLKTKPWYVVLQEPGIKIGRTDPALDPKGALTQQLLTHAEQVYKIPGLAQKVLGAPQNPDQVRPEENLVGRLQSGQIDVGFFYSTETTDLHIPYVPVGPEVALGAQYTVTVVRDGENPAGAERFVAFLLSPEGKRILREHGLDVIAPTVTGDAKTVPPSLRPVLTAR